MTDPSDSTTRLARQQSIRTGCLLVALILLVMMPVALSAGSAQSTDSTPSLPAEPAVIVDLGPDESARVTVVATFDQTTDSEREAFEVLRANETARERRTDQFATRMRAIASRAENATGRDMGVRNPAMAFTTENDTGIVGLSVTWDGLAAHEGDQLVLREPFDNDFDIDRSFSVVGPEGYELRTATPTPATQEQNEATWNANTQLNGFETVFVPSVTDDETSGIFGPGFGFGIALVAVLVASVFLVIRQQLRP